MRYLLLLLCLLLVACGDEATATVTPSPAPATQTPVVIVIVVTATPEPTKAARAASAAVAPATTSPTATPTASETSAPDTATAEPTTRATRTRIPRAPTPQPTLTRTPPNTPLPTATLSPCIFAANHFYAEALNVQRAMQEQGTTKALLERGRANVAPDGFGNSQEDWTKALDEYALAANTPPGAEQRAHQKNGDDYLIQLKRDFPIEREAACGSWTPIPR